MKSLHTVFFIFLALISFSQISFPCENEWIKTHPVFINEFLPRDSTGMCWIELGNCDSIPHQLENWFIKITGGLDSTGFFIQGDLSLNPGELVAINFYEELWLNNISLQIFNDTFGYHTGLVTTSLEINESTGRCDGEPTWQRQIPSIGLENTCQPFVTTIIQQSNFLQIEKLVYRDLFGRAVKLLQSGIYFYTVVYSNGSSITRRIAYLSSP